MLGSCQTHSITLYRATGSRYKALHGCACLLANTVASLKNKALMYQPLLAILIRWQ
jgi:hypothetical protein